jgi:hypothetical protein
MAATLLTLKYFRMGRDVVAGGFLIFAIAEAVLMLGTARGSRRSARPTKVPQYYAGAAGALDART